MPEPEIPPDEPESDVGMDDAKLSGWYNDATGELAPGFEISADDIVADIGCGDGGLAWFCMRRGARVVLVDADPASVQRALDIVATVGAGSADGRVGDAHEPPVADAFASRVICTEVLEHVDDPARVMAELVRIGRPNALYLISAPGEVSEHLMQDVAAPAYYQKPNHVRMFKTDALHDLVENAGLKIERRLSVGFYWSLYMLFFWQANTALGARGNPLLEAWTATWRELMKSKQEAPIRDALNQLAPRTIAVVARKPQIGDAGA